MAASAANWEQWETGGNLTQPTLVGDVTPFPDGSARPSVNSFPTYQHPWVSNPSFGPGYDWRWEQILHPLSNANDN